MLAADKGSLSADTAVAVVALREKELSYYVEQNVGVGTMSALLAGYSYTVFCDAATAKQVNFDEFVHNVHTFDWIDWVTFAFQTVQLVFITMCLLLMINVLQQSWTTLLLGSSLALRGPPGSDGVAIKEMSASLALSTRTFVRGLSYFAGSTLFYLLGAVAPLPGILLAICVVWYWSKMVKGIAALVQSLQLPEAKRAPSYGRPPELQSETRETGQTTARRRWKGVRPKTAIVTTTRVRSVPMKRASRASRAIKSASGAVVIPGINAQVKFGDGAAGGLHLAVVDALGVHASADLYGAADSTAMELIQWQQEGPDGLVAQIKASGAASAKDRNGAAATIQAHQRGRSTRGSASSGANLGEQTQWSYYGESGLREIECLGSICPPLRETARQLDDWLSHF